MAAADAKDIRCILGDFGCMDGPDAIDVECHKDVVLHVLHDIFGVRHGFNPVHACIGNIGNI